MEKKPKGRLLLVMDNPIPHGPANMVCPFHRQRMSKVCHTCPLWQHIRGKNPQSHEEIDRWQCALSMLPVLLIENSQMSRQTGAAVESLRNVVADSVPVPYQPYKQLEQR